MKLVECAIEARLKSYSPYSNFKVGAAVELKNGKIILGTNIENASYGLSMCAERVALFKTISEGYTKDDIVAIAVVGDTELPIAPCGACLQVMLELINSNTKIILANLKGDIKETYLNELLPYTFTDKELK